MSTTPGFNADIAFRAWCERQEPAVLHAAALRYVAAAQKELELISEVAGTEATRAAARMAEDIWRLQVAAEILNNLRDEGHVN